MDLHCVKEKLEGAAGNGKRYPQYPPMMAAAIHQ